MPTRTLLAKGEAIRSTMARRVSSNITVNSTTWIDLDTGLDHLCCYRACVNVKHLEVVTRAGNSRRRWVRWWARQAA